MLDISRLTTTSLPAMGANLSPLNGAGAPGFSRDLESALMAARGGTDGAGAALDPQVVNYLANVVRMALAKLQQSWMAEAAPGMSAAGRGGPENISQMASEMMNQALGESQGAGGELARFVQQQGSAPGLAPVSDIEMAWLNQGFDAIEAVAHGPAEVGQGPRPGPAQGLASLSGDERRMLSQEINALSRNGVQTVRQSARLSQEAPLNPAPAVAFSAQSPDAAQSSAPGQGTPQPFSLPASDPLESVVGQLLRESRATPDSAGQQPYAGLVQRAAKRFGLDENLLRAVIQTESDFNPQAVSRVGAQGLMQLMPATARELGVNDAFDPEQNVMGGAKYLKALLDRYDGQRDLALAAYNWGMGNLERQPEAMPAETRNYIAKINRQLAETALT